MIYAQINNNIIVNSITIEDLSLIPLFSEGYSLFLQIDNITPLPSIGWIYDPTTCSFSPPLTPAQSMVVLSMRYGNEIILEWNALNLKSGIYSAGQTAAFLAYTSQLYSFLLLGYLNDAVDNITTMIADTSPSKTSLDPFLTNDILYFFQDQIQTYINNLPSLG